MLLYSGGGKIVFADSNSLNPNINADQIEGLITPRTKAIVPVHYAGIACDMDKIMELANKHNLFVVEDAAQAIESFHLSKEGKKRPLGSIGHLAAFSFHETKNVISGEGGMLAINDERFIQRAEIMREKGTNRASFFRGEVDKYNWVDIGSSFLPSEIIAAFLYAQLENLNRIQERRGLLWGNYYRKLKNLEEAGEIGLPSIPSYATNNSHMFYLLCKNIEEREKLIKFLKANGILAVFHYLSLHKSPFYKSKYTGKPLTNSDRYSDIVVRLPLFFELEYKQQEYIVDTIYKYFHG